jgi:hypothetical protein
MGTIGAFPDRCLSAHSGRPSWSSHGVRSWFTLVIVASRSHAGPFAVGWMTHGSNALCGTEPGRFILTWVAASERGRERSWVNRD